MKDVKKQMRALVYERLKNLSAREREEHSKKICAAILDCADWREAKAVLLFAALPGEPDLEPLLGAGCDAGKQICFPRVNGDALDIYEVRSPDDLRVSRWALREPLPDPERLVQPGSIDLVLVPGVAFAEDGRRLGRGGGFYDRLLSLPERRATKIGVCFAVQRLEHLPVEGHDVHMDRVLSD